ncbi:DUF4112 domain-containing protein [Haoranjiania flava]|uniref:DUF4112 domain-containing protein n=1 Tax=Haoranjiania flava TaxID=1856322 RepID=A0AAE3IN39_9BACT|nr:DUF4112 domain-containing protein [Haoranjiania flava]MCU7695050.1 DUF4112 domain-containing protein [Haoranjiania flava]
MNQKNTTYVKPPGTNAGVIKDDRLKWVERMSKLMDDQFSVGGHKFGIDPLLNFVPYAGDIATYLMSAVLVVTMFKHGVSGKVAMKMIGNITLDAVVGAIPVLGWIFDFKFKANRRNVNLLRKHYTEGKDTGSAKPYIMIMLVALVAVMILVFWVAYQALKWLLEAMNLPVW